MTPRTPSVESLIATYGLEPHPEGGYFKETYRSTETIPHSVLPSRFAGDRGFCTAIYFLLTRGACSRLHRIAADEVWHFYLGGPLVVVELRPGGSASETWLGHDLAAGQRVQHVVKAGTWFGSYPAPGTDYAFVGCTVAPGFEFADFELGRREKLVAEFPGARAIVEKLT